MSLRWKIATALASIAALVATLAAVGSYLAAKEQLSRSIDESLIERGAEAIARPGQLGEPRSRDFDDPSNRGGTIPGTNDPAGRPIYRPFRCPGAAGSRSISLVQVIAADGTVTSCSTEDVLPVTDVDRALAAGDFSAPELNGLAGRDLGDGVRYSLRDANVNGEPVRVLTIARPSSGALQLGRETAEADRVLGRLGVRLFLVALGSVIAAAAVGFALATRLVRPIRALTRSAQHIAETGDLNAPIDVGGTDEIGILAASFSTMVDSLATSQEQQQRLISDASHEMRTPLTSLRTNLELLARAEHQPAAKLPASERSAVINDLQFETQELTTLLTELVELATDRAGGEEEQERLDLEAVCRNVVERAVRRTGRAVALDTIRADDAQILSRSLTEVVGRPHQLERAVMNLVENAMKYSPETSPIEVRVDGGQVTIRDHGPGIAHDDLPRIFDRFYRATSARTQPGSGLGLAIVEQIVTNHGGTVFARNHVAGGAEVGFTLPEAPPIDAASS